MGCEPPWPDASSGKFVHVVGRVTDEVFSFLGPAANALARSGFEQTVVMIDDVRYRHHLQNFHESAEVVLTPSKRNSVDQWRTLLQECRKAFSSGPIQAVHLHGILPYLVGAGVARAAGLQAAVFFSPHGSRSLGSMRALGTLALAVVRPLLRPFPNGAIVTVPREAIELENWASVAVVESPVSDLFLKIPRNEARHPLIVTGGRVHYARSVAQFAQFAVLLSGADLGVSFNWIGTVDAASRQRLSAANIGIFDVASEEEFASRLAAAWIYTAPGGMRGFPLFLARAMASGLPCVVVDSPHHRGIIRDGETGFLCRSERAMIERIATLLDNPTLRARIGAAAREEAQRRFGEHRFSARLLAAYADPLRLREMELLEAHG